MTVEESLRGCLDGAQRALEAGDLEAAAARIEQAEQAFRTALAEGSAISAPGLEAIRLRFEACVGQARKLGEGLVQRASSLRQSTRASQSYRGTLPRRR